MTKTELNTLFTAKVNNYLANGYTFHLNSMSGSQGEIGKVDLTNGKEIIRIMLESGSDWNDHYYLPYCYTLTVGRATKVQPGIGYGSKTIWNQDLEVLDQVRFYCPTNHSDYLITKEEAMANREKAMARARARNLSKPTQEVTDKTYIKALLPYLHRLNGCKSVKARHITQVRKDIYSDGSYRFLITITKKNHTKVELLDQKTILQARMAH